MSINQFTVANHNVSTERCTQRPAKLKMSGAITQEGKGRETEAETHRDRDTQRETHTQR